MVGKLPFPCFLANTQIKVVLTGGLNEDGEPSQVAIYEGKCIYDEKTKQVLDDERRLVRLSAKAIIEGDIHPGQDIEGYVQVAGSETKRQIFRATRPRNPDGSVYSTELELM